MSASFREPVSTVPLVRPHVFGEGAESRRPRGQGRVVVQARDRGALDGLCQACDGPSPAEGSGAPRSSRLRRGRTRIHGWDGGD